MCTNTHSYVENTSQSKQACYVFFAILSRHLSLLQICVLIECKWTSHMVSTVIAIKVSRYIMSYIFNYVNPVCCVATVCHQVRFMYWGHLGHFHRKTHSKWYQIVCMRYLACTFSQMKSINMFSLFLQSGVPRHFLWRFIAVWIYNLTVFMLMYVNVDLKL